MTIIENYRRLIIYHSFQPVYSLKHLECGLNTEISNIYGASVIIERDTC